MNILKFLLTFFLFVGISVKAQSLHHDMLSSQGGTVTASNGVVVRYSVGQQTVAGSSTAGVQVQQGFQQNNWNVILSKNVVHITTTVYPNPFVNEVNFAFSEIVEKELDVLVYDILGRIVYSNQVVVKDKILTLDLRQIASAEYLIKLSKGEFVYYSKIIKNQN